MNILIITTELENAIRNVKDLAPKLTWHGQKNGVAVWSVGNVLIGLWARTGTTTQMEIQVFRPFKHEENGFLKMIEDDDARNTLRDLSKRLQRNGLLQSYPDLDRIASETLKQVKDNPAQIATHPGKTVEQAVAEHQAELAKLADKTAEQAAEEYFTRFKLDNVPTSNQAMEGQPEKAKPREESKVKRIFGLRAEYLIAAIILGILISIASLFLFPDWGLSIRALVILFPLAFAGVTNFIANFRKAFE